jgi:hypothetical protein
MHEVDLDQIDFDNRHGQKMLRALLQQLKDRGGLKYREGLGDGACKYVIGLTE